MLGKFNILIPNSTGPTNIGDQATLMPLVGLIKQVYPNANLTVHSTDPPLYEKRIAKNINNTLYSWGVFENRNTLTRIYRILLLLVTFWLLKLRFYIPLNNDLNLLIIDYKKADLIIFVGGGYLRSQKGITQSLNLLMICLLFQYAKLFKAKKIITPLSFGPFAYGWQEKYVADVLQGFDVIAAREKISYQHLKKNKVKNLVLSSDMALMLNIEMAKRKKNKKFILGFTVRKWLNRREQHVFENSIIQAIVNFSEENKVIIQPIVQVDAPNYGDVDFEVTRKIVKKLKAAGLKVLEIKKVTDLTKSIKIYSNIDLLLGMRMHSNILAILQGTPFVAISYEYKTQGIVSDLGMEDFFIKIEDVNQENLYYLLMKAYMQKKYLELRTLKKIKSLRKKENERWKEILGA